MHPPWCCFSPILLMKFLMWWAPLWDMTCLVGRICCIFISVSPRACDTGSPTVQLFNKCLLLIISSNFRGTWMIYIFMYYMHMVKNEQKTTLNMLCAIRRSGDSVQSSLGQGNCQYFRIKSDHDLDTILHFSTPIIKVQAYPHSKIRIVLKS